MGAPLGARFRHDSDGLLDSYDKGGAVWPSRWRPTTTGTAPALAYFFAGFCPFVVGGAGTSTRPAFASTSM
jgi:hypothetical protein